MIWMDGAGELPPIYRTPVRWKGISEAGGSVRPEAVFDHVELSGEVTGEIRFRRELVSRLVQEVRTAHTTGDIQRLTQAVDSGAYVPDPSEIAARMLLEGEYT